MGKINKKVVKNERGNLTVISREFEQKTIDYKGSPYTERGVQYEIFDANKNQIATVQEGNILDLEGVMEIKIDVEILYYKNFFAVCHHKEETDLMVGVLEGTADYTTLYTYKGIVLETNNRKWVANDAAIDAYNNRAYLFDKDREELEGEKELR